MSSNLCYSSSLQRKAWKWLLKCEYFVPYDLSSNDCWRTVETIEIKMSWKLQNNHCTNWKKKDLQHENIHIQKQCRSPRVHVDKLVLTIPSTSVWLCSEASGGNSEPTDHLATSLGSIFSQPSASGNTSSFIDCCYKQGRVGYLIYHQLIYHQSIYQLLHNTKFPEPKGT